MTNQKQWWEDLLDEVLVGIRIGSRKQIIALRDSLHGMFQTLAQKEYERGLKESNSGRIMYEKGKQDGVRECVEILREIHNKLCDNHDPAALQTLKVLDGLSKLPKEQ